MKEVKSFVYLGSVIDQQGGTDRDVTARVGKARGAFVMLKKVWASVKGDQLRDKAPHLQLKCEGSSPVRL